MTAPIEAKRFPPPLPVSSAPADKKRPSCFESLHLSWHEGTIWSGVVVAVIALFRAFINKKYYQINIYSVFFCILVIAGKKIHEISKKEATIDRIEKIAKKTEEQVASSGPQSEKLTAGLQRLEVLQQRLDVVATRLEAMHKQAALFIPMAPQKESLPSRSFNPRHLSVPLPAFMASPSP